MTTKVKIAIAAAALLVSFAFGRWLAPYKTKTVIQTVTVESKTSQVNKNEHQKTTTTETDKPDGTKIITSVTTNDTNTDAASTDNTNSSTTSTKEVTRSSSRTGLYLLGGYSVAGASAPTYGGMVTKDVLGPIAVGAFGLSNGTFGAAVGVSF